MTRSAVSLVETPPFRLGTVEVRPATREVVGGDSREVLEPRVMEVPVMLAGARAEVVSREALIVDGWGGRSVSEDAVNRVIARIRRLSEGIARDGFRIETIIKVGYRLTEVVPALAAAATDVPAVPPQPVDPDPPMARRALLASAIGGTAALAGGAGWWWLAGRDADPAAAMRARARDAARPGAADGPAQSVGFLREATRLGPNDARNWGALALAYQSSLYYLHDAALAGVEARMRAAAARALQLDPDEISARTALALVVPRFGDWTRSEEALRAVLASQPDQIEAALALSRLLSSVGRTREALAVTGPLTKPLEMMPSAQYWIARLLWIVGRLEESDTIINRAFQLWPRDAQVWFTRFWLLCYTGRADAALAMSASRADRPSGIPEWNFALIDSSARAIGVSDPALKAAALKNNDAAARRGRGFTENAVELAAVIGRPDRSFAYIDAYYFERGFTLPSQRYASEQSTFTRRDHLQTKFLFTPPSRPLRADPRFAILTRRIGLDAYWRRSGTKPDASL